jgi:hypothetical protein
VLLTPIYVVNRSTLVPDHLVATMCAAVSRQVVVDIAPAFGVLPAPVLFVPSPPSGGRVIAIVDSCDDPQALGYHTESGGVPDGFVGCKPELDAGAHPLTGPYSVASILSHEVAELLLDPAANRWADSGQGFAVAFEVADPVQSDCYNVQGVTVSSFVLPAWFDPDAAAGSRFDFLGRLSAPFSLSKGGYWVEMSEGQVSQKFGEEMPDWLRATKSLPTSRAAWLAGVA